MFELEVVDPKANDAPAGGCGSGSCGCQGEDQMPGLDEASRRDFLKRASTVMVGGFSLTYLAVNASEINGGLQADEGENAEPAAAADGDKTEHKRPEGKALFGFIVDTNRCIGAGKCLTACRKENNVPEGFARTWVERFVHFKDGHVQVDLVPETGYEDANLPVIDMDQVERAYFAPKLCNHCSDAPCDQVCPVHASFMSPEGVHLVDPDTCIGCAYCVQACPYGVRFINPETHNADKCTWCYHRIMKDEMPACVEACPTGARVFGRLDDPNSEIRKRLATIPMKVLKEHLGTNPNLWYMNLPQEVV